MSNRVIDSRRSDKDMIFVISILIMLIVASYYLGRVRATYEHSFAFCRALFGDTPRHAECMTEKPWERQ